MVAENFDFQECLCDAQLLSCLLHHSPLCHRFSSIVHQRKIWNNGKKNVYRIDSNLYFICTIIFIAGAFVFSPQKLRENEWHKHLFRLFEMQKQWEKKGNNNNGHSEPDWSDAEQRYELDMIHYSCVFAYAFCIVNIKLNHIICLLSSFWLLQCTSYTRIYIY